MGNIVLLDDLTINKIAAGEVIERPASVIKEMVENSIDAGAKNITVEIKNGGISLIRITDDGCGIAEDDMEIAFERHATSKIRSADDLETVRSMGFRGEALASIAAIANVEMVSKKEGSEVAHKIVVEGGNVLEKSEAARGVGTTITVQKLFFNTPVRYKFLKKDYTEAGYIEDAVTRIALINKNVAIKLINNGKTILQTNGNGDFKTLIYSIYGKDIASEIIEVDYTYEDMKVTGVIGKPVIARSNRSNQLFFVNGRYIKDKSLSAAAEQGYKGMIPIGRYGFLVLNIDMDPKLVDVNVHPAKLEVRFEDENKVFKAIYHAIKSNLAKSELVADVQKEYVEKPNNNVNQKEELDKKDEIANIENPKIESKEEIEKETEKEKKGFSGLFSKVLKANEEKEEEKSNMLEEIFNNRKGMMKNASSDLLHNNVEENKVEYNQNAENEIKSNEEISKENVINPNIENVINQNPELSKEDIENQNIETNNDDTISQNIETNIDKQISEKIEAVKKEIQTINDNLISQKVNLDGTIVSSDTREIAVDEVNSLIKEKTQELMSTKMEVGQETQSLSPVSKNEEKASNETQILNTEEIKNAVQTLDIKVGQQTQDVNIHENVSQDEEKIEEVKNTIPNNILDNSAFESIASKLVEAKLKFDSTQTIDTARVRDASLTNMPATNPEFNKMYKETFGEDSFTVRREKEVENQEKNKLNVSNEFSYATENLNVFENNNEVPEVKYKFIGIAFDTYIIIQIKDELYMIDQHAAHERIMYEKVKANYYSKENKDQQFLLLPDVITLAHKEMMIAKENKDLFEKAGFSFEEFGDNTIKLNSVPSMCEDMNTKQLFLDILDEIDTVAINARQEKEDKFIATVACKAAVKAKMKLDVKEVNSLMNQLLSLSNPFTCPHGRPTAIKMTKYDMERKFSRK